MDLDRAVHGIVPNIGHSLSKQKRVQVLRQQYVLRPHTDKSVIDRRSNPMLRPHFPEQYLAVQVLIC